MQHKTIEELHHTLEIVCYVAGAGAFGVFVRWLQDQLAFDDAGLAQPSFFHVFVVLYMLGVAFLFLRFIDRERGRRRYLPEDFCEALANPGKLYTLLRWAAGGMVCLGALLLFFGCETDEDVVLLRILSGLGLLYGLSYPWLLSQANKPPVRRKNLLCLVSSIPLLFFALWLVISYKENAINSVVWSYVLELLAIILSINAFFRLAGFCFDAANGWRCLFFVMVACTACVMALADERYLGMQIIFLGTAALLLLCVWILFANLRQGKVPVKTQPDDGFERL